MSIPGLEFRRLLVTLGDEDFYVRHAGKTNAQLAKLWTLAAKEAVSAGMSLGEAIEVFMAGYDAFFPSLTPWAIITANAISGVSQESEDVVWMLRTAGETFAAYGVTPKFRAG